MSNTLLHADEITRAALTILHQKLTFVGNINREYDSRFAREGAKIGDALRIRLPNQFTVRSGASMAATDVTEQSVTLTVSTQKGVDMQFSSVDLTMDIMDFSRRFLDPAMSVLAANIEADALSMYKDVWQMVDDDGVAVSLLSFLKGRQKLNDSLAPLSPRKALISSNHSVKLVDALKGLFHSSSEVEKQYRDGMMGKTAGFDFYESSLIGDHTTGDAAKTTTVSMNGSVTTNGTTSWTVTNGSSKTFKKGDIITVADTYDVHPETKATLGTLKQWVVTADAGATTLTVSPPVYTSGPLQNVPSTGVLTGKAIVKVGAGASETLNTSMVFHPDAFTFATADLQMPEGVDFASRQVMDGISMRIVRNYDIASDRFPCRLDVLYGYQTLRPQLACRIHADG